MAPSARRSSDKKVMEDALRQSTGFAEWPALAMNRLLASSDLVRHTRGDRVSPPPPAPSEILMIVEGYVLHSEGQSDTGRRLSLILRGPGDVLGFTHVLRPKGRVLEYYAKSDALVIHTPGKTVFDLLDEEPTRWKDVSHMLMRQERVAIDMAYGQMVGNLEQRVGVTLNQLAAHYGARDEEGRLHLRVTQQDLADILRISRQSVNGVLKSWTAAGAIELKYNTIVVLDPQVLSRPPDGAEAQERTITP